MVIIGRGRECSVVLLEHNVSRQHARLQYGGHGWTLTDLGSTNGDGADHDSFARANGTPGHRDLCRTADSDGTATASAGRNGYAADT